MAVEREVKLTAEGPFELPDLAGVVDGATPVFLAEEKLEATYYDTADLRLARWGITVRYRREGTAGAWWTVKLPDDGKVAGGLSRTELPFPGGPRTVPVEATRLLTGYLRGDSLEPVARLTTRRRRVRLVDDAGAPVVEIDDDRVSVLEGAEVVAWFREIEVEAANGSGEDALAALRRVLLDHGARETVAIPKLVRALGARAMEGPEVEQPQITAHSTAGQVARAAIAAGVTRMVSHDPGVRLGEDPEAVHQARVATRRLRSDLRTFRSLLDEEWVTSVRTELKWVAGALGQVRDADVLLERLRGHEAGLPSADRKAASALLGRLEAERGRDMAELLAVMDSPRYQALLDRLVQAAGSPPLGKAAAGPAAKVLPGLVRRPWRHLAAAVADLPADPDADALHQVRIRAKRCRYAAEACEGVIGKPARRLAEALAALQTTLGDLHDATVAEAWLRDAARSSPGQALVAGQLIVREREAAGAARDAWAAAWDAASRKKLRAWLS